VSYNKSINDFHFDGYLFKRRIICGWFIFTFSYLFEYEIRKYSFQNNRIKLFKFGKIYLLKFTVPKSCFALKIFKIIWLSNLSVLSISDDGYCRNACSNLNSFSNLFKRRIIYGWFIFTFSYLYHDVFHQAKPKKASW
jgi:hypothetical protein